MQNILVFGAGRSAFYTIHYLLEHAAHKGWKITVADSAENNLQLYRNTFPQTDLRVVDVHDVENRKQLIRGQHIVISLLPARFHILIAQDCAEAGVHLITPSYLTADLQELEPEVRRKNLVFINELGLDPGIDHMSAMRIIDGLKQQGAEITSFKSYCGGLMALGSDNNPWRYKLSWNPYNVIRAGHDGALCRINEQSKYIPYHRLFKEIEHIHMGDELFDGYYNRNSERYISLYGLETAQTFLRGTLRYEGYCRLWQIPLSLGLTTDAIGIHLDKPNSWKEFICIFTDGESTLNKARLEEISGQTLKDSDVAAIQWLLEEAPEIPAGEHTPAQALQGLLEEKWRMDKADKDRVVMIHEFEYRMEGKSHYLKSWMDISGEDVHKTAMAKTVGLPLALGAELIADGHISTAGMLMPTAAEVYVPLLAGLEKHDIHFKEEEQELN